MHIGTSTDCSTKIFIAPPHVRDHTLCSNTNNNINQNLHDGGAAKLSSYF